jgi:hypothetical protein
MPCSVEVRDSCVHYVYCGGKSVKRLFLSVQCEASVNVLCSDSFGIDGLAAMSPS